MAAYEHLLKSYDVGDLLDDIASADPPAYLRRCFAEAIPHPCCLGLGCSNSRSAPCLDAIVNGRDYESFEQELIATGGSIMPARAPN